MKRENKVSDKFEDVCLRTDYLSHIKEELNPTYLQEYKKIIYAAVAKVNNKSSIHYQKMGFVWDDLVSFASMYTLHYMHIYSVYANQTNMEKFIAKHTERYGSTPTDKIVEKYNTTGLFNFIKQRLEHLSTLCQRKSRNVYCQNIKSYYFARTKDAVEVDNLESLIGSHEAFGYRSVMLKEYNERKKISKAAGETKVLDENGFEIFYIYDTFSKNQEIDNEIIFEHTAQQHHLDPFHALDVKQTEYNIAVQFDNMNNQQKIQKLNTFIRQNKNNSRLSKEVSTAKKMLIALKSS